jgi:hypothetical protein
VRGGDRARREVGIAEVLLDEGADLQQERPLTAVRRERLRSVEPGRERNREQVEDRRAEARPLRAAAVQLADELARERRGERAGGLVARDADAVSRATFSRGSGSIAGGNTTPRQRTDGAIAQRAGRDRSTNARSPVRSAACRPSCSITPRPRTSTSTL